MRLSVLGRGKCIRKLRQSNPATFTVVKRGGKSYEGSKSYVWRTLAAGNCPGGNHLWGGGNYTNWRTVRMKWFGGSNHFRTTIFSNNTSLLRMWLVINVLTKYWLKEIIYSPVNKDKMKILGDNKILAYQVICAYQDLKAYLPNRPHQNYIIPYRSDLHLQQLLFICFWLATNMYPAVSVCTAILNYSIWPL
jgi:hypothetical protein